jgi:hypothetical protein
MKEPCARPDPVLSSASREAIRAFLAQSHAALLLVQDVVRQDERTAIFSLGGIPEMETTVVAIEQGQEYNRSVV